MTPTAVQPSGLSCTGCRAALPAGGINATGWQPCPRCGAPFQLTAFPALLRPIATGSAGERVLFEGESSCFYHPHKKATVHCENCGRFLCALCDMELNGLHRCPSCLESGQRSGKISNLEQERTCHDWIVFWLAILPLILWPFTILSAPVVLFLGIRHWNTPGSIVPRWRRLRLMTGMLIAGAQLAGWIFLFYTVITR